jgi:hypothetical protein
MNQLVDKCLNLADQMAQEINGDLFYVPDEDLQQCLNFLSEDNLFEVASEIAQLAHFYN